MASALISLFDHNRWANLSLLETCQRLNEEQLDVASVGAYGSIRDTLLHLAAAEERYLSIFTGHQREDPIREGSFPGFDKLAERLAESGKELIVLAAKMKSADVLQGRNRGVLQPVPAPVVLVQIINHATEHRTNITTILSQLGVDYPRVDGWAYGEFLREREDKAG
jgi:uncharacterized damage-inducible protein DinB